MTKKFQKCINYWAAIAILILFKVSSLHCNDSVDNEPKTPPNVILILTDDQDVVLNGLTPMQSTIKLLANEGVTFTNAFTSSPVCCPSRSSILSGQYAHNHGTRNNSVSGGCNSRHWQEKIETRALPVILQNNGYETFYAGKYLNEYKSNTVPPGWNNWFGLHGNSKYYNYTLTENGIPRIYEHEYLTDVLKDHSLTFLSKQTIDKPFFAFIAPPAPHEPFTPAARHEAAFANVRALRTPNFNAEVGELDKHWLLRMRPSVLPDHILDDLDVIFRKRWQSLLAVDEMVAEIVQKLNETGLLDNTYVIFTSDHGYHIGQFAQAFDKRQPYETDIRVPLIVRGPNIQRKTIIEHPIVLLDLFPTILDFAGIAKPDFLDGQSFAETKTVVSTSNHSVPYNRQILIEYWGEGNDATYNPECEWSKLDRLMLCSPSAACHCLDAWNNTFACIRHISSDLDQYVYCEFDDKENFVEAYDLINDPYQMYNLAFNMLPSERALYSLALGKLAKCKEDSCRQIY